MLSRFNENVSQREWFKELQKLGTNYQQNGCLDAGILNDFPADFLFTVNYKNKFLFWMQTLISYTLETWYQPLTIEQIAFHDTMALKTRNCSTFTAPATSPPFPPSFLSFPLSPTLHLSLLGSFLPPPCLSQSHLLNPPLFREGKDKEKGSGLTFTDRSALQQLQSGS